MHSAVSRRTILSAGAGGTLLSLLSACGLRLDTPPDLPTLDPGDLLRNHVAEVLAATSPTTGDPVDAAAAVSTFTSALGPVWTPPSTASDPTPTAAVEPERSYRDSAAEVTAAVFSALSDLSSPVVPVLVDVGIGMGLSAGTVDETIPAEADKTLRKALSPAGSATTAGSTTTAGSSPDSTSSATTADGRVLTGVLTTARAASYAYERLAVTFPEDSTLRRAAQDRIETLGSLAGDLLERLTAIDVEPEPDSPAWQLDPEPDSPESAKQLAAAQEDAIAASLLPWLATDAQAALPLWLSARARTNFTEVQLLRYRSTGGTAAPGSPAAPTPNGASPSPTGTGEAG